jgi:hypothetical protein
MDRQEFSRQLGELRSQVSDAVLSYNVYMALWPTEETVDILNRHRGFFSPIRNALYHNMMMGFAKVFDRDRRTISLVNLLREAGSGTADLVPRLSINDMQAMDAQLSQCEHVLLKLKNLRDQELAHKDANPKPVPRPKKGEIDNLIETIEGIFNSLSSGHDGSIWHFPKELSAEQTSEVLRILQEEMKKRKAETDRLLDSLGDT